MIEVGKTYLDIWGNEHEVLGHVSHTPKILYSKSCHFCPNGYNAHGYDIVDDLSMAPTVAISFWELTIAQIERTNSEGNIGLVQPQIGRMRERIKMLEELPNA